MKKKEKRIEDFINLPYRFEVVPDVEEGGFVIRYPDLPGCISTGETIAETMANAEDAKREWLEAAIEDGVVIPKPSTDYSYSGQFKLRIPRSLHRLLSEHARDEGISMNQYCLYLLSRNDALRTE